MNIHGGMVRVLFTALLREPPKGVCTSEEHSLPLVS